MSKIYEQLQPVVSALDNRISVVTGAVNEVENEVGEVKSALSKGVIEFNPSDFVRGSLSGVGNPQPTYTYRVSTTDILNVNTDIKIIIDTGFRIYLFNYLNGKLQDQTGWREGSINVSGGAGRGIKFVIARTAEDTTETANISVFVSKVNINTSINDAIKDTNDILNYRLIQLPYPTTFELGALNTNGEEVVSTNRAITYFLKIENDTTFIDITATSLANTTTAYIFYYDASMVYIGVDEFNPISSGSSAKYKISRSNTEYIRIMLRIAASADITSAMIAEFETNTKIYQYASGTTSSMIADQVIYQDVLIKGISHRGWYRYPENTMIAWKMSKKLGFAYLESDVRFTSDNVPVMLHDSAINRTARNADGSEISSTININSITYTEALQYDFGIYKGTRFAGQKISTLHEFLKMCKCIGIKPYVEVKQDNTATDAQLQTLVETAISVGIIDDISWIGGYYTLLQRLTTIYDKARVIMLRGSDITADDITSAQTYLSTGKNEFAFCANYSTLTASGIELCKSALIPLEVYTIDTEQGIIDIDNYISAVISNKYDARQVLYNDAMNVI